MIKANISAAKAILSAAGFRAGNLIDKKTIEIGGQVLPLRRTNLIPTSLYEKENEKEREMAKEREKAFPSLRDSDTSNRSVRAGGAGVKIGTGTESCSSVQNCRCCFAFPLNFNLYTFFIFSSYFLSASFLRAIILFLSNHDGIVSVTYISISISILPMSSTLLFSSALSNKVVSSLRRAAAQGLRDESTETSSRYHC